MLTSSKIILYMIIPITYLTCLTILIKMCLILIIYSKQIQKINNLLNSKTTYYVKLQKCFLILIRTMRIYLNTNLHPNWLWKFNHNQNNNWKLKKKPQIFVNLHLFNNHNKIVLLNSLNQKVNNNNNICNNTLCKSNCRCKIR